MSSLLRGGMAGLLATGAMTVVMAAGKAMGLMDTAPPKVITERASRDAGVNLRDFPAPVRRAVWLANHGGYGTAAGSLYMLLARATRHRGPLSGIAYGIALWAVSYFGLLPALGLFPPPPKDTAHRQAVMVSAHVVYGACLGALCARFSASRRD